MEGLSSVNILVALAVLVFVAIGLDVVRRVRRSRYENIQMSSSRLSKTSKCRDDLEDIFGSDFPAGGSRIVGMRNIDFDAMEDVLLSPQDIGERYTSGEPKGQVNMALEGSSGEAVACMRSEAEGSAKKQPQVVEEPQIMIIHLMSEKGKLVKGSELLSTLLDAGLRFGAMGIFHFHKDGNGSGPIIFSLANILNPGTFDLDTMTEMSTPGVTMFVNLDEVHCPETAFNEMLSTANLIAPSLHLHVLDESRSSMTPQTIDHNRQLAREFIRVKAGE